MFQRLATQDGVEAGKVGAANLTQVPLDMVDIGMREGARLIIEGFNFIAGIDEHRRYQSHCRTNFEYAPAWNRIEQVNLRPLVNDALARVILRPLRP